MHNLQSAALRRIASHAARAAFLCALGFMLAGCYMAKDTTASVPNDYRQRHPIRLKEGDATLTVLQSSRRGGLTPQQRADVVGFAQNWKREATGGIIVDVPASGPNAQASSESIREIRSILANVGVPLQSVAVRPYTADSAKLAPIKINYPKIMAQAGPCGLWPDDLGPSLNSDHDQNREYYNFGCATQRNTAAMIDNSSDLIQPRAEAPTYNQRRTQALEKYRQGQSPSTVYPDANKGTISDLGK